MKSLSSPDPKRADNAVDVDSVPTLLLRQRHAGVGFIALVRRKVPVTKYPRGPTTRCSMATSTLPITILKMVFLQ
eukprot:m.328982 g.328982  ORF g.328982 m.328982 type:complete len:75 (+) comp16502_c1_seq54:3697-3921(+)